MKSTYNVIYASAGSGKTYALVSQILAICLKFPKPHDAIQHILALTFTNKAANEMKHRILSWLKDFTDADYLENDVLKNIQDILKNEGIRVSIEDLHERSKNVLDFILHHYSTLNISTIDKFNSRLIHQFSYELGLAKNFNLEINPEPFLIEAVDKMLDNIGTDKVISDAFMDLISYNLDQNERTSLSKTLYKSAKNFVQDKHYFELQKNDNFSWEIYESEKQKIRNEIKKLNEESLQIAIDSDKLIRSKDLEISDFAGASSSSIAAFFTKYLDRKEPAFPGDEEKALANFEKITGSSKAAKARKDDIEEILPILLENRKTIINHYIKILKLKTILKSILPLKINKDIQDQLALIEEENDIVLLSKFNVMIHENLKNEPSAFIYEKVGTKFNHYFFDEFQDTSQLQWQNFIPLRDHTITSENLSFNLVGDPKQSIYRFRGGDSKIMLNIINKNENTPVEVHKEELKNNWRSSKNIVDFNNQLYQYIGKNLSPEFQNTFGESAVQIAQSKKEGRVKINLLENGKVEDFFNDSIEKMQKDIQEILDSGYKFSDITILCRGNKEISQYSQLLGNVKIMYQGKETYLKTISEKGLTLELSYTLQAVISFLSWHQNTRNTQYLAEMLYYLNKSGKIKLEDYTSEVLGILELKTKEKIENYLEERFKIKLNPQNRPRLNLYNFTEYYIQELSVENQETDYLLNFLEMLYNFSQNTGYTIKDFLKYWDEEGRKLSIQTSENIDAIQIMTIHKAKGLEFPIVLLPMQNKAERQNEGWFALENENLQTVNIENFSTKREVYFDDEMKIFNSDNNNEALIDRLCVQYVATTRAVNQMFFYLQKPNKSNNYLEIIDYIDSFPTKIYSDENHESSFDLYPISNLNLQKEDKKENSNILTKSINSIKKETENYDFIKIATPSKNYQERNTHVRNGIFTHEILAKINHEKDISKILNSYLLEGNITFDEKKEIENYLYTIIRNPNYAEYFSDKNEIINERDIMIFIDGESKIYRPDRLIKTENGFIIIDFKTGKKKDKHLEQISEYKNVLEKLGFPVVKTELLYL